MKPIFLSLPFLIFLASCDVFITPCSADFIRDFNDLKKDINSFATFNQAEKIAPLKEKCQQTFEKYGAHQRCVAKVNREGPKSEEVEVSMASLKPSCDALP